MTSVAEAVQLVEECPDFRVLRRFVPDPSVYLADAETEIPEGCKTGVFVDVETTGLETRTDKIIELALVPFTFDPNTGIIYDAGKGIAFFNDPKSPIPPEITKINGITDEMVRGQKIDLRAVFDLVDEAVLIVAHHADFDRKMLERLDGIFAGKHWACSQLEVPWGEVYDCRAAKLNIILEDACGQFFPEEHRALGDCHVGVNVLANAIVQGDGATALSLLLDSARQTTCRVWAVGAPYPKKDTLKARGYYWSPGPEEGGRKCWYRDVRPAEVEEEVMFARDIGGASPNVVRFGAKDRYSIRVS